MDSVLRNHFEQLIAIFPEKFYINVKLRPKKKKKKYA